MVSYPSTLPTPLQNNRLFELFHVITRLRNEQDCERFFSDLCTCHELKSLSERWEIARLVHAGFPYRVITKKTGASSATIARVVQCAKYGAGGLTEACATSPVVVREESTDALAKRSLGVQNA